MIKDTLLCLTPENVISKKIFQEHWFCNKKTEQHIHPRHEEEREDRSHKK
jgi:hypothetical protein